MVVVVATALLIIAIIINGPMPTWLPFHHHHDAWSLKKMSLSATAKYYHLPLVGYIRRDIITNSERHMSRGNGRVIVTRQCHEWGILSRLRNWWQVDGLAVAGGIGRQYAKHWRRQVRCRNTSLLPFIEWHIDGQVECHGENVCR